MLILSPQGDRLTMTHISVKPHIERMAIAELGRHLCHAKGLNTWTCENGLQTPSPGRPQGSPPRSLTYTHNYSRGKVVE